MSREVDVAFWNDPDEELSDLVDAHLGEDSPFDVEFGYYAQGVSVTTVTLPDGWRDRTILFPGPTRGCCWSGCRRWACTPP